MDTPHEILVNKLCAILGRSEVRDLQDVHDLLAHDGDLDRALADAPRKDAGFSPLSLAYALRTLEVARLGELAGLDAPTVEALETTRDSLIRRLTDASRPDE